MPHALAPAVMPLQATWRSLDLLRTDRLDDDLERPRAVGRAVAVPDGPALRPVVERIVRTHVHIKRIADQLKAPARGNFTGLARHGHRSGQAGSSRRPESGNQGRIGYRHAAERQQRGASNEAASKILTHTSSPFN